MNYPEIRWKNIGIFLGIVVLLFLLPYLWEVTREFIVDLLATYERTIGRSLSRPHDRNSEVIHFAHFCMFLVFIAVIIKLLLRKGK